MLRYDYNAMEMPLHEPEAWVESKPITLAEERSGDVTSMRHKDHKQIPEKHFICLFVFRKQFVYVCVESPLCVLGVKKNFVVKEWDMA